MRVLEWALRRVSGEVDAVDAISGRLPVTSDLNIRGLDLSSSDLEEIFALDSKAWSAEADLVEEYFEQFGDHLPPEMSHQLELLRGRIRQAEAAD